MFKVVYKLTAYLLANAGHQFGTMIEEGCSILVFGFFVQVLSIVTLGLRTKKGQKCLLSLLEKHPVKKLLGVSLFLIALEICMVIIATVVLVTFAFHSPDYSCG